MQIDVLDFLALPDAGTGARFNRQRDARGEFKGDASDIITPIDVASGFGQWKHIKNPQGWPWDLRLYDESFVYDWITEGKNGWSSDINVGPKSFKKFVRNHFRNGLQDGLVMFPRFVDSITNDFDRTIDGALTTYATFENCVQIGNAVSLGSVRQQLQGPFLINHGGDVGTAPTLLHNYYWTDNGTPTLEQNFYALDFGWISWKLQRLNPSTGFYELANETNEPLIFAVDQIKIVFPCF